MNLKALPAISLKISKVMTMSLVIACGGETITVEQSQEEDESATIPSGALIISGSVENGEDESNSSVLTSGALAIERSDGQIIANSDIGDDGRFEISLEAGALNIEDGYSIVQSEADERIASSYEYRIKVAIADDGNGKALGLKKTIDFSEENLTSNDDETLSLDLGVTQVKEISAIIGQIAFEDSSQSIAGVDVYIPGYPFFVRTGDDGKFNLLFIPQGTYTIRMEKFPYIKDQEVSVVAGTTSNVEVVTFGLSERNPLPLDQVVVGSWSTECFYYDMAAGVDPETPKTGTVAVTSLDDAATVTGTSCVMRNQMTPVVAQESMITLGDGAVVTKHSGSSYYFHKVMSYDNNTITFSADASGFTGDSVVEVWTRD